MDYLILLGFLMFAGLLISVVLTCVEDEDNWRAHR